MTDLSGPWLFSLGIGIGAYGTLIGAGGGFILIPILLFAYPSDGPEVITAISLAVVFCNSLSGSFAYALKRRIDYRSALLFAAAGLPGAVLGVFASHAVPRAVYEPVFGVFLISASVYLLARKRGAGAASAAGRPSTTRRLTDAEGKSFEWAFDMRIGLGLSAAVGFVSSFLGIGGGIIHVPAMVHLMAFPVHLATATSHLILAIMSGAATLQHGLSGSLSAGFDRLLWLAPGVVLGAPLGARWSQRVHGTWILRLLALALLLVGLRLVLL